MARIIIDRSERATPSRTFLPNAAPLNVGNNIGRGLINLGSSLSDISQNIFRKEQQVKTQNYVSQSVVNSAEQIEELKMSLRSELDDPTQFNEEFNRRADEIYSSQIQNAPTEQARSLLQQRYTERRVQNRKTGQSEELSIIAAESSENLNQNLNRLSNLAFETPSQLDQTFEELDLILNGAEEYFPKEKVEELRIAHKARITRSAIKGAIDLNPNVARSMLQDSDITQNLNPETVQSLQSMADRQEQANIRQIEKTAAKQRQDFLNQVEIQLARGTLTQLDLDEGLESGLISGRDFRIKTQQLESQIDQQEKELSVSDLMKQVDNGSILLDPTNRNHKDVIETYYNSVMRESLEGMSKDEADNMKVSFAVSRGVVPDTLESELKAGVINGDPSTKTRSADIIVNMTRQKPNISRQFDNKTLQMSYKIIEGLESGLSPEDAVELADIQVFPKASPQFEERRLAFEGAQLEFDQGEITRFFTNDPNEVPVNMILDWKTNVENNIINAGMSEKSAKELAYKQIQKVWSISKINGIPEYTKAAPEQRYEVPGLDPSWMRDQLIQDVDSADLLPEDVDLDSIFVEVNPRTMNTESPTYFIQYTDENGAIQTLTDENLKPLEWKPDFQQSSKFSEIVKENEEQLKEIARSARNKRFWKEFFHFSKEAIGRDIDRIFE